MKEIKNLTVTKTDISKIGHTVFNDESGCSFVCHKETFWIEEIFLRNILELFGEDYKITGTFVDEDENGVESVVFTTNFPNELYENEYDFLRVKQFMGE